MWFFFHKLTSPRHFYDFAGRCLPWVTISAFLLLVLGLYSGLLLAPPDYQQGEGFRIIYIHVPAAFLAMSIYMIMAIAAFSFLVWRIKLTSMLLKASAPIGAWFCFLALFTGAIWGKPMWGTWWIWDARLTTTLILFFLYMGVIGLQSSIREREVSDRAGSLLVLVGSLNIPIIHYSVYWWNTLHQGATISQFAKSAIDNQMLYPLLINLCGFFLLYIVSILIRLRIEILQREKRASWVMELR